VVGVTGMTTRIFGSNEEKVTGCWKKKLPNEGLHSVYSSINTTSANKSRRLIGILTWQEVQQKGRF
jgi:hypothetical protein